GGRLPELFVPELPGRQQRLLQPVRERVREEQELRVGGVRARLPNRRGSLPRAVQVADARRARPLVIATLPHCHVPRSTVHIATWAARSSTRRGAPPSPPTNRRSAGRGSAADRCAPR